MFQIKKIFIEYKINQIDIYIKNGFNICDMSNEDIDITTRQLLKEKEFWKLLLEEGPLEFINNDRWLYENIEKATCEHKFIKSDGGLDKEVFEVCEKCGHSNNVTFYQGEQQLLEYSFKPCCCLNCKYFSLNQKKKCTFAKENGYDKELMREQVLLGHSYKCDEWQGRIFNSYQGYKEYEKEIIKESILLKSLFKNI